MPRGDLNWMYHIVQNSQEETRDWIKCKWISDSHQYQPSPAQPTQPLHQARRGTTDTPASQTSHPKIPTGVDFGVSCDKRGIWRWDCHGDGGLMTLSLPTLVNAASASCDRQCCPCWSQGWGPAVAWAGSSRTKTHMWRCPQRHTRQQTYKDRHII